MGAKIKYIEGSIVGSCVFLKELSPKIQGVTETIKKERIIRQGLFKCSCGKEFETRISSVVTGNTSSCGCLQRNVAKKTALQFRKHGQREHPLYTVWILLFQRCNNPKNKSYHNYGGRGIRVCERWNDIDLFIQDMYSTYIKGYDLDRINNNGDYSPDNCRWVTRKKNCNNMRKNRIIVYNNISKTVSEWVDYTKIPYTTLINRLNKWDVEKAFTTPYVKNKRYEQVAR